MSRLLAPYPNIRRGIVMLIESSFPELAPESEQSWHVGPSYIPNLIDHLPYVRVGDVGGNDNGITDTALQDIDVYHHSVDQARDLSARIQALLLSYPHRVPGVVIIDSVRTALRPSETPWADDRIKRFYGSYQVSARR